MNIEVGIHGEERMPFLPGTLMAGALVCLQARLTCVLAERSRNHFVCPINIYVLKLHCVRILLLIWKFMGERENDKFKVHVCEISE